MNYFLIVQSWLQDNLHDYLEALGPAGGQLPPITVEPPRQPEFGDVATPIAMQLARPLRRPPLEIAQEIIGRLPSSDLFSRIEAAKPGFINFTLSDKALHDLLRRVESAGSDFARGTPDKPRRIMVEFVSANPTGPLHIGHGRNAVVGDTVARVLEMVGHNVHREYYYNDAGVQMRILGESLRLRYLQECGEAIAFPDDHYRGDYMIDIARKLKAEHGDALKDSADLEFFTRYAADDIMAGITADCRDLDIRHDQYFSETTVHKNGEVEEALERLRERGDLYEHEGALWIRTSKYGDDKDRVVKKSDGSYTYLAPDIAYHLDKVKRGFDQLINVLGADHHGYVPRLRGAFQAMGYPPDMIHCIIIQMVRLKNQPKLSTRRGDFLTLREMIDELGKDVVRFFLLMRNADSQMEFDWALAKDTSDKNPVFKCQYAHARMCSLFRKAAELGLPWVSVAASPLERLTAPEERTLMRTIALLPEIVRKCAVALEPQPLTTFALDLATAFNQWFSLGNTNPAARVIFPEDTALTQARLALVHATKIALRTVLDLLGVGAPERL
ncbi:MAG: arginine--tRNA ligase [Candidatus Sumerlaeia bacterium]